MTIVAVVLVVVIVGILVVSYVASTNNEEVRLRNRADRGGLVEPADGDDPHPVRVAK